MVWRAVFVAEEVRISPLGSASDPSAQLVKLRQSEGIRPVHDQRVRVGDIQPGFDDRGTQQDIDLAFGETLHHRRQLVLIHLSVSDADPRFGDKFAQVQHHRRDGLHPVMDEEDLSAALQLT